LRQKRKRLGSLAARYISEAREVNGDAACDRDGETPSAGVRRRIGGREQISVAV